jgi:hypothetical protein
MELRIKTQRPKGRKVQIWLPGELWTRIAPMVQQHGDLSNVIVGSVERQLPAIEKEFKKEQRKESSK